MRAKQRVLSLLLCGTVLGSVFSGAPMIGRAQGEPCNHEHTEDCYRVEAACIYEDNEESLPEGHVCTEESGCQRLVLDCAHVHNESCGGIPGAEDGSGADDKKPGDEASEPEKPEPGQSNPEQPDSEEEETEDAEPKEEELGIPVLSWEWIDEEGALVWSEEKGLWGLGLPGADEEQGLTAELLLALLPAEITATLAEEQTEVLALDWDFSVLPEDGAWEEGFVLAAGLPEGYVLAEEAAKIEVLVEIGGGGLYRDPVPAVPAEPGTTDKYVSAWTYVSRDKLTIEDRNFLYFMDSYLSTALTEEVMIRRLKAILPEKIQCQGYNTNSELINAGFTYHETQSPSTGQIKGYVKIQWNVEEVVKAAFLSGKKEELTFYAMPVSNPNYRIRVNTNDPNWKDSGNGEVDTAEAPDVLNLTVVLHDLPLEEHIVPGINPPNTTVNLFDYWVDRDGATAAYDEKENGDLLDKGDWHNNSAGTPVERTGVADWNKGINEGRLLLFGDGNIHAGFWNKGSGAGTNYGKKWAGMTGIVKCVLDEKGYPEINIDEMEKQQTDYEGISDWQLCGEHIGILEDTRYESTDPQNISKGVIQSWKDSNHSASLDYLFSPKISHPNKRTYENAKGLFQIDSNGYYYYDMRQNFAEYDKSSNQFILYDAPAVDRTDASYENGGFTGGRSTGNFFPFNKGEQVFDLVETNPDTGEKRLSNSTGIQSSNREMTGEYMNHHLGMTVEIDFRQPLNGSVNTGTETNVPMTFQFSGDDDVWIFIDDVLVLDLGGIHSEIYGTIDFASGKISVGQSWKSNGFPYKADGTVDLGKLQANAVHALDTDLLTQFTKAGKDTTVQWNGATFASNTSHTLKMFYLERGNYDSSLALRFNLQQPLYQQLAKVDQDGDPVGGVGFALYEAELAAEGDRGAIECLYTDRGAGGEFYVKMKEGSAPLVQIATNEDGSARFLDKDGNYFNFADRGEQYYILKETRTPKGYRTLPVDIVLGYDPSTSMLSVANRWSTGAYACSVVHMAGAGRLTYGDTIDVVEGTVDSTKKLVVDSEAQSNGLVIAVPMQLKQSDLTWEPMSGGNMKGFSVFNAGKDAADWPEAVLSAALRQASDSGNSGWYISWDGARGCLAGTLRDLPGLADRYKLMNQNGDMQMIYGIIDPEALQQLGIAGDTAEERYQALGRYVKRNGLEKTVEDILSVAVANTASGKGFNFLNASQFNRDFRSLVYIPNDQRELWVMKIDQDGKARNGASFGLYDNAGCAGNPVATGTTAMVNGQEGTLIFSPSGDGSAGYAKMEWATSARTRYYLKELSAPEGCRINPTIVPVIVGSRSIYADAGTRADGVSVMAGVGRLTQTMRQFAEDNKVDVTLQDITAIQQQQPSDNANVYDEDWVDVSLAGAAGVPRSINLHFGKNAVVDYGLHDEDGGQRYKPFFVTDTGFIRARVRQNYAALIGNMYEGANPDANKDDLGDADLTNLFSLLNVVLVTDATRRDTGTGRLVISKMLGGSNLVDADYTANFQFRIKLTDAKDQELAGAYYFYGTNKVGYLSSGDAFPLHHDERITILGLPAGTKFEVEEVAPAGAAPTWHVLPETGVISGDIIRDATSFAPFYNSRDPWGDVSFLLIHKTVAGGGDRARDFHFTVSFTNADGTPLETAFPYDGDKSGTIASGDEVTLRHDEYVIIFNLPEGIHYAVSEREANQDGYTTTFRGEAGDVGEQEIYIAEFSNFAEWVDPPEQPSDGGHRTHSRSSGKEGTLVNSPDTGDGRVWKGLLLAAFLSGIGVLVSGCWKNPKMQWSRRIRGKGKKVKKHSAE